MRALTRRSRPRALQIGALAIVGALLAGETCCAAQTAQKSPARNEGMPKVIENTERLIRHARALRAQFQSDPQRPRYHMMPPWAWMNDINGPIFWKGRYHLFYQHNPDGAYWKHIQWGHASSNDLVHWTHHPIALSPTPGGPDREGCYSGVAVVNNGVPTLVYLGVPDGMCLATSQDDDLIRWTKHPGNPVIPVPKRGDPVEYRVYDPCVWRKGKAWYALSGWGRCYARPNEPEGDTAFLFKSADLVHWEYMHPFYASSRRWTEADEDCAVPDFFGLGNKHVLLFASHKRGAQYYVGRYEGDRFYPERHARINRPGGHLIAPISMLDPKGRRLFFGWINEARSQKTQRAAGWAGVMTLPQVWSLAADGTLRVEPAPELAVLRINHRKREGIDLTADRDLALDEMQGDCLELAVEMERVDAREFGVKIRCSPDGAEQTVVICDPNAKALKVDASQASLVPVTEPPAFPRVDKDCRVQVAPSELPAGEPLRLRVFLDKSVVEVFANGRQCITQRIYPSRPDSVGVRLFSRGGSARVRIVEAWDMVPAGD